MSVTLYTGSDDQISIRAAPLAELGACLHALAEPDHHPLSRQWIDAVRAEDNEELIGQILSLSPLWGPVRARYLLPMTPDTTRSFEEELSDILELPLVEFTRLTAQALLASTSHRPPPDVMQNVEAADDFLVTLRHMSWQRAELGTSLVADPEAFRNRLLRVLNLAYAAMFTHEWAQLHPMLAADVTRRRSDQHLHGSVVLSDFSIATELDDPPRVVFDKLYVASARLTDTPCVLVPSRHVNPHFVIKHLPGYPVVIQYAVAADTSTPSTKTVQQRLAVLNEPTRLAICRSILRRPMAGIELARLLDMTPPQVSRHLRKLREAGLVHHYRDGSVVRYELDRDAVRRIGVDLILSLRR